MGESTPRTPQTCSPQKVLKAEKRKAMAVERATRESMLAVLWSSWRQAET